MFELISAFILALVSNFVFWVFVVWQGDRLVSGIRKMPEKWQLRINRKVYLKAIKSYPFQLFHTLIMTTGGGFFSIILLGFLAVSGLRLYYWWVMGNEDLARETVAGMHLPPVVSFLVFLFINIGFFWYYTRNVFTELIVPDAAKHLDRIRECVRTCASKEQFLDYVDLESTVQTHEDLQYLLVKAATFFDKPPDILLNVLNGIIQRPGESKTT
jgi:hypothetical protein